MTNIKAFLWSHILNRWSFDLHTWNLSPYPEINSKKTQKNHTVRNILKIINVDNIMGMHRFHISTWTTLFWVGVCTIGFLSNSSSLTKLDEQGKVWMGLFCLVHFPSYVKSQIAGLGMEGRISESYFTGKRVSVEINKQQVLS